MQHFQFFNPLAEIRHTENRLPHWQQSGAVYFVTFRLADAIPAKLRDELEHERESWLKFNPPPWSPVVEAEYHKRFSAKIEQWLDAGHGSCIFKQAQSAAIVDQALGFFEGQRLHRISSVVMPNHVHALFVLHPEHLLEQLLGSWKTYTARQVNSFVARAGTLWQRDYFDRLIRDEQHFCNCVRYIRRNPTKAGLVSGEFVLFESDLAKQIE